MRKFYRLFQFICVLFVFQSCRDTETATEIIPDTSDCEIITLDEAIDQVDHLLDALTVTRTNPAKPKISECFTIKRDKNRTPRRASVSEDGDPLLYIVNFTNDEGYAIVAAEKSAPSTILALTESGHLDPSQPIDNPGVIIFLANMEQLMNIIPPVTDGTVTPWTYQSMGGVMCTNQWDQHDPYNKYAPKINGVLPPAGCTATALAQYLTIFDYPTWYNGYRFNWSEMEKHMQVYLGNPKQAYRPAFEMIGRLFEQISLPQNLDMQWGLSGSGAYLYNVPRTLANLGFSNPGVYSDYYDAEKVRQALLDFDPVLVTGYAYETTRSASESDRTEYMGISVDKSSITYTNGHTWLVDQLVKMQRTLTIPQGNGRPPFQYTEEKELIHCNFGWDGSNNGLYYSGAFDTNNGCVEPLTNGTSRNYQYYLQTFYGAAI